MEPFYSCFGPKVVSLCLSYIVVVTIHEYMTTVLKEEPLTVKPHRLSKWETWGQWIGRLQVAMELHCKNALVLRSIFPDTIVLQICLDELSKLHILLAKTPVYNSILKVSVYLKEGSELVGIRY